MHKFVVKACCVTPKINACKPIHIYNKSIQNTMHSVCTHTYSMNKKGNSILWPRANVLMQLKYWNIPAQRTSAVYDVTMSHFAFEQPWFASSSCTSGRHPAGQRGSGTLITAFILACVHDLNMTNDSCFMTTADSRVTARGRYTSASRWMGFERLQVISCLSI